MKKLLLLLLLAYSLLVACNHVNNEKDIMKLPPAKQLENVSWLLGTWYDVPKTKSPAELERELTEIWTKADDSTWNGESFVISYKDTVFYESIELQERNDNIYYIVRVKDQNKEAPVIFQLTAMDSLQMVFENATHDFPSKITYTRITHDSLYAEISGFSKGQERKEGFSFKKIN